MNDSKIDASQKMYVCKYIIIFNDIAIYDYPDREEISLDEIMNIANVNGFVYGVLTVILEAVLDGTIYQYGNYGNYWVKHGTTNGLA